MGLRGSAVVLMGAVAVAAVGMRRRGGGDFGPVAALAGAGNVHLLTVLGDGPAGDNQALLLQLFDQLIIRQRIRLVFLIDDLLQPNANDVPGDVLAFVALGAADKEPLERENAAR